MVRGPGKRSAEEALIMEPRCGGKGGFLVSRKQEWLEANPSMLSLTWLDEGIHGGELVSTLWTQDGSQRADSSSPKGDHIVSLIFQIKPG